MIVEAAEDLKISHPYYPGNDQLFKVDFDSPSLPLNDAELFHHYVVRLLFESKIIPKGGEKEYMFREQWEVEEI